MAKLIQVAVGFHSFGTCPTQFAVALSGVVRYEGTKVTSIINMPSPYVTEARNKIVKRFLTQTNASHLWMVDVDLEFPEDALMVTLRDMANMGAEIIFGAYALGDFRPSIFAKPGPNSQLPTISQNMEGEQAYKIFAGSTGWLLMTRAAAQKIWDNNKDKHWPWFDHDVEEAGDLASTSELVVEGQTTMRIGEDFTFSKRAREAGFQLYGTTSPLLIHIKYQPMLNSFHQKQGKERGLNINVQVEQEQPEEKIKITKEINDGQVVEGQAAPEEGIRDDQGSSGKDQGSS